MSNIDQAISEYKAIDKTDILKNIMSIVEGTRYYLEGNCFYEHNTFNLHPSLFNKQVNLYWCGKQVKTHICEIGFNAGHSSMLFLLGIKTPVQYTVFDLGCHPYTRPCLDYIANRFQNTLIQYVEGNSMETMPFFLQDDQYKGIYDVVHVDGGHTEPCMKSDMKYADQLLKNKGILIVDDTHMDYIYKEVDRFISTGNYKELHLLKSEGYEHRILIKDMKAAE